MIKCFYGEKRSDGVITLCSENATTTTLLAGIFVEVCEKHREHYENEADRFNKARQMFDAGIDEATIIRTLKKKI